MRNVLPWVRQHPWLTGSTLGAVTVLTVTLLGPEGRAARADGGIGRFIVEQLEMISVLLSLVGLVWFLVELLRRRPSLERRPRAARQPVVDRWHNPRPGHQYVPGRARRSPGEPRAAQTGVGGTATGRVGTVHEVPAAESAVNSAPTAAGTGVADDPFTGETHAERVAGDEHLAEPPTRRDHFPPRLALLHVDREVVGRGLPVEVTWAFENATSVSVDGVLEHPSRGSTTIVLPHSRAIEVVGHNAAGRTVARTRLVVVVPAPTIETVRLPAPPSIRLHVDVSSTIDAGRTASQHLDRLFAAQDSLRPVASDVVGPIGVPRALISWLRGVSHDLPPIRTAPARNVPHQKGSSS
ncbi:hypothetical protein [Kineococcus sp. SYSU DK001]|uniref:hypothetical protein n=1 Tax=Kineococcus sp. SYSU DK001 TaxID=3383122 RepID=UPI003D7E8CD5